MTGCETPPISTRELTFEISSSMCMETSSRPCTFGCKIDVDAYIRKVELRADQRIEAYTTTDTWLEATGCVGNSVADPERCLLIFDRSDLRLLNHSRLAVGKKRFDDCARHDGVEVTRCNTANLVERNKSTGLVGARIPLVPVPVPVPVPGFA